jgi:hypothetical protein
LQGIGAVIGKTKKMKYIFRIILFFIDPKLRWQEGIYWMEGCEFEEPVKMSTKGGWILTVFIYPKGQDPYKYGHSWYVHGRMSRLGVLRHFLKVR